MIRGNSDQTPGGTPGPTVEQMSRQLSLLKRRKLAEQKWVQLSEEYDALIREVYS